VTVKEFEYDNDKFVGVQSDGRQTMVAEETKKTPGPIPGCSLALSICGEQDHGQTAKKLNRLADQLEHVAAADPNWTRTDQEDDS